MIKRILKIASLFFVLTIGLLGLVTFYFLQTAGSSHGPNTESARFTVEKGEDIFSLGGRLEKTGYISSKYAFVVSALLSRKYHSLQAGDYSLSGSMTIPEIIEKIVKGEILPPGTRITFPEGWTIQQMADRLTANYLPGDDFLAIVTKPFPKWKEKYPFLSSLPEGQSLEGYLFPDTYIFPPQSTGELIVGELLKNFGKKVTPDMITSAQKEKRTLHQAITLASIVEAEVRTPEDRKLVADIFLRRIQAGVPLQSDATLSYILGTDKVKYSIGDTKTNSPYNTYTHPGLPPGPINSPSLQAIQAVLNPTPNEYFYFLNNAETGETVFSKTFEEHVGNKAQNGL